MALKKVRPQVRGFTLVELIVVVVVVGILATIGIAGYNSITERSQVAAAQANLNTLARSAVAHHTFIDQSALTRTGFEAVISADQGVGYAAGVAEGALASGWTLLGLDQVPAGVGEYALGFDTGEGTAQSADQGTRAVITTAAGDKLLAAIVVFGSVAGGQDTVATGTIPASTTPSDVLDDPSIIVITPKPEPTETPDPEPSETPDPEPSETPDPEPSEPPVPTVPLLQMTFDMSATTPADTYGRTVTLTASGGSVGIAWGDGQVTEPSTAGTFKHTFASPGVYQVTLTGPFTKFRVHNTGGSGYQRLVSVDRWDNNLGLTDLSMAFYKASRLESVPAHLPPGVTNLWSTFADATVFNGDISGWDTSNVTNMAGLFSGAKAFNQPIGTWNTSQVTTLDSTFFSASMFNQDLSGWDTSNVTSLRFTFHGAPKFNGNVSTWNTADVTTMASTFSSGNFAGDVSGWNTANVTTMAGMFANARNFNSDISGWNTAKVTDMSTMFQGTALTADLSGWDTSAVTTMKSMFSGATVFNGDVSGWDTSKVTDMSAMFSGATVFNGDVSGWDTSKVTTMAGMFANTLAFNQDISGWNTANVTSMRQMFAGAKAFNQDLSGWNVAKVYDAVYFRAYATAYVLPTPTFP